MNKNANAKKVLFEEIGINVGVYDEYSKVKSHLNDNRKTSGTHLLKSIEDGWADVAINSTSKSKLDLTSMLSMTRGDKLILNKLSTSIARRFFRDAYNEKLESIINDGVAKASVSLSRDGHVSNDT